MLRLMCKSKIHRATITKVDLHYEGSIGIDSSILKAADIYPGEIVQVLNITNAARFETYAIEEVAGSGTIGLYGAAAHLGKPGDLIIILSYGVADDKTARKMRLSPVYVDSSNKIVKRSCRN